MTKAVAGAALGYYGWYLMVKADSQIKEVSELDGKKVGITRPAPAPTCWRAGPCRTARSKFTTRAARRRRPGAEHAVGQRRRGRALFAAVLQDHAGEAGRAA